VSRLYFNEHLGERLPLQPEIIMSAVKDDDLAAMTALLRGQLAAVASYAQAIEKFEDPRLLADLETIREEHVRAESLLREKVVRLGGPPVESPGPWCTCATVTGDAKLSPATALAALRQGEEQSVYEFENSLKNESVDSDCKNLIRAHLLPGSRNHVAELDRMMGGM
jgi:hypothetical protein